MAFTFSLRFNWPALVFVLVGMGALAGSYWTGRQWHQGSQLRERGRLVQAILELKETIHRGRGPRFWVYYRFETADGKNGTGKSSVGIDQKDEWDKAIGPIDVKFLPEAPEVNAWVRALPDDFGPLAIATVALGIIGILALAIGVVGSFMSREKFERRMQ